MYQKLAKHKFATAGHTMVKIIPHPAKWMKLCMPFLYTIAFIFISQALFAQTASDWIKLGNEKIEKGDNKGAISDFTHGLQADPKNAWAFNCRGDAKYNLIHYEDAIKDYDQAIALEPKYAEAFCNRGDAKFALARYEDAVSDYDQAIANNPTYDDAWFARANSKMRLGRFKDAIADFSPVIARNPKNANALIFRGYCYFQLGNTRENYQAAINDYDKGIQAGGTGYSGPYGYRNYRNDAVKGLNAVAAVPEAGQSRNGYKVNGITVAGGNGLGNALNQLNIYNENIDFAGISVDVAGDVYVYDRGNIRIMKWPAGAKEGQVIISRFSTGGLFLDGAGNLFYTDYDHAFTQFNLTTNQLLHSDRKSNYDVSDGIFVDRSGNVYISDNGKRGDDGSVQKWEPGATKSKIIAGGHGKGMEANQLRSPKGIFVDNNGNLFVADDLNDRVQKWPLGAKEGITVAKVQRPQGVFVDPAGNVFVAVPDSNRVELWAPGATQGLTVAGGGIKGDRADLLNRPTGVCLDAAGNLYVVDNNNNRVQKFEKTEPNAVIPQPAPTEVIVHNEPVKPTPEVVKPDNPLPAQIFTTLNWLEPVSDVDRLPGGVYSPTIANLSLSVRIVSTAPVDAGKIQLLLNGNSVSQGGKMHDVDLRMVKTPVGAGKKYQYLYTAGVTVPAGKSTLQVSYHDDATDVLPVSYTPQSLNLYVLAIGTKAASLHFPEKDALDFAQVFKNQQGNGRLFQKVEVETLTGENARAFTIADKITEWSARQYGSNDVLFIFISSHGYTENGNLKITGSDYKTTAANLTTLDFKQNVLDPLAAANCKKFVFLDACHSGAGIKAVQGDVANAIQRMLEAGNNTTIITSSNGEEQSWEDDKWQNGAFTKAIKEALEDKKGDADGNGIVSMDELFAYLSKRVPQLVKEADKRDYGGHPVTQTPKMLNPKGDVSIYVY